MSNDWPIPSDLTPQGRQSADTILAFLTQRRLTYHGGGGRFYSPAQWRARGEDYGTDSLLIITHDGGDHAGAFNSAYEQFQLRDDLQTKLYPLGVFMEQCTSWYSAVYPL